MVEGHHRPDARRQRRRVVRLTRGRVARRGDLAAREPRCRPRPIGTSARSWRGRPPAGGRALGQTQLDGARGVMRDVARAIAGHEPVTHGRRAGRRRSRRRARRAGPTSRSLPTPIDDSWIRDSGPIVVRAPDGARHAVHFRFNAWGEKYAPYADDADDRRAARGAARPAGARGRRSCSRAVRSRSTAPARSSRPSAASSTRTATRV